jgi:hypothetical protein
MSIPNRLLRRAALAALATVALVAPAVAQETAGEWKVPHLKGHTFSPVQGIPDAFVRSYVRSHVGVSKTASVDFPLGIIDGDTLVASAGNLVFADLGIEYQQTIRDWIAFRVKGKVLGRLGTGTTALLSSGVSATAGFELGWLIRLLETESSYLSLSADVRNTNFTTISIRDFVNDWLEGGEAELVQTTPSMRAGIGLRWTYAISPLVGLVTFGETGFGEPVDQSDSDEWFWRFGGSFDFDLAAAGWLPIGLAIGYAQDSFPEGGTDITDVVRTFAFRVGYTGRRDLALGLNLGYSGFPTEGLSDDLSSFGGTFDIRYYF